MKNKLKKSTVIPLLLLIYLIAISAIFGVRQLRSGNDLLFYGVVCSTLVIILLVHLSLKKKEKLQEKRENENYCTYKEEKLKNKNLEKDDKK